MTEEKTCFSIDEFDDGCACVTCTDKLTLFSFEPLENTFSELFAKGINRVAFEYTQDMYSPAFGGVFLAAAQKAQDMGGSICLVGLSKKVRDSLNIAGFDSAFCFADSHDEARTILNSR